MRVCILKLIVSTPHLKLFLWGGGQNEKSCFILFEYAPDIRNKDNESFEEVSKVLKGDRKKVKSLYLKPGDLQIFKGRFSMHRVTKIEGKISRYIALPCYVKDSLKINKPEHSKQVYGKALPIHFERENIQGDGLID